MIPVVHLTGDATAPIGDGRKIIVHCCNDVGGWGAGFVLALSRRWPEPEASYRAWARYGLVLGAVRFVSVTDEIDVANLIGQHGTGYAQGVPPIRYEAIRIGLLRVAPESVKIQLNDTWTAEILSKDEIKVGCQTFKVEAVRDLLSFADNYGDSKRLNDSCFAQVEFPDAKVTVSGKEIPVDNLRKLLAAVDSFPG